jgi:hypothetical protein
METKRRKVTKMPMFMIESPHTKEECLGALDGIVEESPEYLSKFSFGCMAGDHTGYATVEADSVEEARKLVPSSVRGKAKVVPVTKFSKEQIDSFHAM